MSNKKHEEFERKNEKWRLASNKAIDLKYSLEDVLSSFSVDEKQTVRYAQFIENVSAQFDHILGDVYKTKLVEEKKKLEDEKKKLEDEKLLACEEKRKNKVLSMKSAIIAAGGAIVVQLIQSTPQILSAISSLLGGHP